jgi:hypothetical protein
MGTANEDEEVHGFADLPVWMQAVIVGTVAVYGSWTWLATWQFVLFWLGVGGFGGAVIFLAVEEGDDPFGIGDLLGEGTGTTGCGSGGEEPVDRLSSYQKSKLKDAVGMECEVTGCGTKRSLHVHHISPRSEGGGNELSNLIVVCRNHHADCDNGSFNRTQQRQIIRGDRFVDEGIEEYWRGSVT